MNTHKRRLLVAIAASTIAAGFGGCENPQQATAATEPAAVLAPARPSSVPEVAVWVGGADGGVFVDIRKDQELPPQQFRGAVYTQSGVLWYYGRFLLEPADAALDPAATREYSGWDGDTLYFADGRRLRALEGR